MFAIALDADGTLDSPAYWPEQKTPGPLGLGQALNRLRAAGYVTAIGTGASRNRIIRLEWQLDHAFDVVGFSYCGGLEQRNGHVELSLLIPKEEQAMLTELHRQLKHIAHAHHGEVTDAEDPGACFSFHVRPRKFSAACKAVEPLLRGKRRLQFKPTAHDGGVVVAAASARKQLLVDHLRRQGCKIAIAAGDTEGDLELIQAAIEDGGYPIITRTEADEPANKTLVAMVRQYGRGYIAQEKEPHAHGLLAGINKAQREGFLTF